LFAGQTGGEVVGVLWGLSAAVLWIVAAVRMVRERFRPARVWVLSVGWWGRTFVAPYFLFREVRDRSHTEAGNEPAPEPPAAEPEMNGSELREVNRRLDELVLRLKT